MSPAVLRWLIADTLRQSLWSGVFWLMLSVTILTAIFCLIAGPAGLAGSDAAVQSLQFAVGGAGANTVGLLLALTFTAGFLPAFTDPNAALILLAKPVPRWQLFLGKFLGVTVFFTVQAVLFVAVTWLALGISTGYWSLAYFSILPVLLVNFLAFFSFSALLAVMTRSATACVVGAVLFWLVCLAMNVGRHAVIAYDLEQFSVASRLLSEASYWILPRPADSVAVLYDALHSKPLETRLTDFGRVIDKGAFRPMLSLVASLVFSLVIAVMAAYEIETHDY